ncbi:MAG: hypothetical protein V1837_01295 [Candidatus Woesearchaeota archaeon]
MSYLSRTCHSEEHKISCVCGCIDDITYVRYTTDKIKERIMAHTQGVRTDADICRHLIYDENYLIACKRHPMVNERIEKRSWIFCKRKFLCKPAREFQELTEESQDEVLKAISRLRLDPFEYAQIMMSGVGLKFLGQ